MEYDIFISYSRKDTAIVDQFVRSLTDAGYRVWIDRIGIYSGDQFATNIVEAIENSKILLFFSSASSNESEWTVREIYYALSEHKTIIPIKIDNAKYDKRIALNLSLVDFIQYQKNDFSSAAERLIASVAKHLGKPEVTAESNSSTTTTTSAPSQHGMSYEEIFSLGKLHYDNGEYIQTVKDLQEVAEQGEVNLQNDLNVCCNSREEQQDYQQAVYWYKKATEQGDAHAQNNLGACYANGRGVRQDYKQAVYWYRKAAEQGDADAQCNLGDRYYYGDGVVQDDQEGVKWYRKAAEQGHTEAQFNLGDCYYCGDGIDQDYHEAVKWYKKAAEQGNAEAQNNLGECYREGTG